MNLLQQKYRLGQWVRNVLHVKVKFLDLPGAMAITYVIAIQCRLTKKLHVILTM